MNADQLKQVRPGFHDPTLGSQAVFRMVLQALSHPGRVLDMPCVAELPRAGQGAAAMLLLALLDSDCRVWLSSKLASSDASTWLRFHTGCQLVSAPDQAQFLWLARSDALPALHQMQLGSDEYPDQSATCVIETTGLTNRGEVAWQLEGPGIASTQSLAVAGLPADFEDQWVNNQGAFPRGVDVFLSTETQLVGLPRTTRLRTAVEV
jgi:alpha-D-ribose 1-methylphosphonate 5-triphosphate synthase subunit PhnH